MGDRIEQIRCADIGVAKRYRKEMGNLESLAASIDDVGLLHPIGITTDWQLIFGERRLRASRDVLHRETIAARVFDLDLDLNRMAEHAENEERKALTLGERHALLQAIKIRRPERRGRPRAGSSANEGATDYCAQLGTIPAERELEEDGRKSREMEARAAGFASDQEAARVAEVVEHGAPELVQAMDGGAIAVSTAAEIAAEPVEDQARILSLDDGRRRHEVKRLRQKRTEQKRKAVPPVPPLTLGEQIFELMDSVESLGSTRLDCETVASEYAGYRRIGTLERIRLAIVFLQRLEKAYPKYEAAESAHVGGLGKAKRGAK